jgi:hypothetical protein
MIIEVMIDDNELNEIFKDVLKRDYDPESDDKLNVISLLEEAGQVLLDFLYEAIEEQPSLITGNEEDDACKDDN